MIAAPVKKRKPERIALRMVGGKLVPADSWAEKQFHEKRIAEGDIVLAAISKLRSKGLNRLVHRIGKLCAENIDEFMYMDAHAVIKRLQLEGNIACDEVTTMIPGEDYIIYRIPQSISFDSMDEAEFRAVGRALCRYIAERYWPDLEPEQIELMANSMVD